MAGPARKRKTFGTKIRDQELETKDLYTVVNNKQILQSSKGVVSGGTVNNTEVNNGPGGTSNSASLATAGGSMIGPIAFYVKTKTIASGRLDILSGGTAYSSRVIAAPEGSSADDLIKIGDANNSADFSGQLLFVQGSIANITLKHAASTGNIWIPGGSDFILVPGAIAILQYDESNITGSSNSMWILVASFGGGSTDFTSIGSNVLPSDTDTYDLGSGTKKWQDLYLSGNCNVDLALTVSGTATFNGNVDLGSDSNDTISMTGKVDTNIIPSTGFKDLGDTNTYWDNGYIFNGKFNNISISGTNAKLDMNNKPIEECGDIDFDGTEHIKRSGVDFIEFQSTQMYVEKPIQTEADIIFTSGAYLKFGAGGSSGPTGDPDGYFHVKDASGNLKKLGYWN